MFFYLFIELFLVIMRNKQNTCVCYCENLFFIKLLQLCCSLSFKAAVCASYFVKEKNKCWIVWKEIHNISVQLDTDNGSHDKGVSFQSKQSQGCFSLSSPGSSVSSHSPLGGISLLTLSIFVCVLCICIRILSMALPFPPSVCHVFLTPVKLFFITSV